MQGFSRLSSCGLGSRGVALFSYDEMVPLNVVEMYELCCDRAVDPRHYEWQHISPGTFIHGVLAEISRITSAIYDHIGHEQPHRTFRVT